MKKLLTVMLTFTLCLSLCACGSGNEESAVEAPTSTENAVEASGSAEYAMGEAFGTDNVECVIAEISWITSEEIEKYSNRNGEALNLEPSLFSRGYHVWGRTGVTKSEASDTSFLCVTYSLQNVGKKMVDPGMESDGFMGMISVPYGTIAVIYDDGYTFDFGDDDFGKYCGFTTTLDVLDDPITEMMVISLPNQVLENADKPLKLKITLPSSNEEIEEFIVSIR